MVASPYKWRVEIVTNEWLTMPAKNYATRIADTELTERPAAAGAVLFEGPRACGKTETARRVAASAVLLDIDENARHAMSLDPSIILEGNTPSHRARSLGACAAGIRGCARELPRWKLPVR